jgi:hypothetical protein
MIPIQIQASETVYLRFLQQLHRSHLKLLAESEAKGQYFWEITLLSQLKV